MERIGVSGTEKSEGNVARNNSLRDDGVGIEVEVGEFGLGKAPNDSKPVNKIELSKEQEHAIQEAQQYEDYEESVAEDPIENDAAILAGSRLKQAKMRKGVDRQTAFIEFKSSEQGQ